MHRGCPMSMHLHMQRSIVLALLLFGAILMAATGCNGQSPTATPTTSAAPTAALAGRDTVVPIVPVVGQAPSQTSTATPTQTPTWTPTLTPSPTPTLTFTPTPSRTPTLTPPPTPQTRGPYVVK